MLVTDGEAPIDIAKIARARERLGELPVGVSIIALGQENPALRDLAAYQRGRGERVRRRRRVPAPAVGANGGHDERFYSIVACIEA